MLKEGLTYTSCVKVTLENCAFEGNKTAGSGAAMVVYSATAITMKGCTSSNTMVVNTIIP